MTSLDEAQEAPIRAQRQRFAAFKTLRVDEALAASDDMALVTKVRAITTAGAWDKALADPAVNKLFLRGVLNFGGST